MIQDRPPIYAEPVDRDRAPRESDDLIARIVELSTPVDIAVETLLDLLEDRP
ncbi:MAG: hypothetical protein AAFU61_01040 [Pseudomonadota bacterium]